jgi:hypothetical protein
MSKYQIGKYPGRPHRHPAASTCASATIAADGLTNHSLAPILSGGGRRSRRRSQRPMRSVQAALAETLALERQLLQASEQETELLEQVRPRPHHAACARTRALVHARPPCNNWCARPKSSRCSGHCGQRHGTSVPCGIYCRLARRLVHRPRPCYGMHPACSDRVVTWYRGG